MNDLDDIRRAIDDDIYAHGKVLVPTDGVRRAIARRRTLNRVAVAGTSALVAAAAVAAVTLMRPHGNANEGNIGQQTTNATAIGKTTDPSPTPQPTTTGLTTAPSPTGPVLTDSALPSKVETPMSASSTGAGLPTGGVSGLLAAVQWRGSDGALVAVDPVSGAIIHTYTTGITNPSYDVLRHGTEAYFVATTDAKGCATRWTGIDLVTGNPTAAPESLNRGPVQAAAMSSAGDIAIIEGGCTTAHRVWAYFQDGHEADLKPELPKAQVTALAWSPGGRLAMTEVFDGGNSFIDVPQQVPGDVRTLIALPDGCTPTALTFPAEGVVAGVMCAQPNGAPALTVLRWDDKGVLLMRKDVTTKFKEASISDIAVVGKDIYYVVNAEGVESYFYELTETKADTSLAKDLFHIAAQP